MQCVNKAGPFPRGQQQSVWTRTTRSRNRSLNLHASVSHGRGRASIFSSSLLQLPSRTHQSEIRISPQSTSLEHLRFEVKLRYVLLLLLLRLHLLFSSLLVSSRRLA